MNSKVSSADLDLKSLNRKANVLRQAYLPEGKNITPRIILYWGANQLLPNSGVRGQATTYSSVDAHRCVLIRRMQAEVGLKLHQIKAALNGMEDADIQQIVEKRETLDIRLDGQGALPGPEASRQLIHIAQSGPESTNISTNISNAIRSLPGASGPDDSPQRLRSLSDFKKEEILTKLLQARMRSAVVVVVRGCRYDGVIGDRGEFTQPAQLSFDIEPDPGSDTDAGWLNAVKVISDEEIAIRVAAALGQKVGTPLLATVSDRSYWRNKVRFVLLIAKIPEKLDLAE